MVVLVATMRLELESNNELAVEVLKTVDAAAGAVVVASALVVCVVLCATTTVLCTALVEAAIPAKIVLASGQTPTGPSSAKYATMIFSPVSPWFPHAALT